VGKRLRASGLSGPIHGIVPKPDVEPDERFQLAIQELLDDLGAASNRPRFELIRIVGERWSEVSQAFRDPLGARLNPLPASTNLAQLRQSTS